MLDHKIYKKRGGQFNFLIFKSIAKYNSSLINNSLEKIYKNNARIFLFPLESLARIEKMELIKITQWIII
jgi:hypothetical protein